jgi:hypothetical protein
MDDDKEINIYNKNTRDTKKLVMVRFTRFQKETTTTIAINFNHMIMSSFWALSDSSGRHSLHHVRNTGVSLVITLVSSFSALRTILGRLNKALCLSPS